MHSPEQVREIIAKYQAGSGQTALAREYGCSTVTISHILKREGVTARPFKHRPWRSFADDEVADMVRRWHDGESQTAIAVRYSTAQTVVSRVLIANGVESVTRRQHRKRGEDNPNWRGGRHHMGGYVAVRLDADHPMASMRLQNGYVLEHRLVMAMYLGRPLTADENVHHINGDRTDNRLENLELWSTSQPSGQRAVDLLAWAGEIVERYEKELPLLQ